MNNIPETHIYTPFDPSTSVSSQLTYLNFYQRENGFLHHSYEEELIPYEYIKAGNPDGIDMLLDLIQSGKTGQLSKDPLQNTKYLFVCAATLLTRNAVSNGLGYQEAYNLSDLYIQKMDCLSSKTEIYQLLRDMAASFCSRANPQHLESCRYSRPVLQCFDYVYSHLHNQITLEDLSMHVNLSVSYLSAIFKKETGISPSSYIRKKRIETAQNMLAHSDYSYIEISNFLAFSSHSHFCHIFKKETGMTPQQFRNKRKQPTLQSAVFPHTYLSNFL